MSEFMAMGGYGAYVWTAYGVTALSLLLLFVWSWFGAHAKKTELEQMQKLVRAERRAPSATSNTAVHRSATVVDEGTGANAGTAGG